MSTIRKLITGSAAVLALGLAGGLGAPAASASVGQPASMAAVDQCARLLQEAKMHQATAQDHQALAKKAAQAGDTKKAEYHKQQAAYHQQLANAAYSRYKFTCLA
ncbi:hypothetical protein [Amycolatopsis sp. YIM 10]|uniref:hypothetical protein n=1 Tax=Amycolatopsis sp. YIM 10 TaxID=2653857 RepID=UPI0012904606|nr:hypothetical protein [Amycolatopsis sp. YIM 10]